MLMLVQTTTSDEYEFAMAIGEKCGLADCGTVELFLEENQLTLDDDVREHLVPLEDLMILSDGSHTPEEVMTLVNEHDFIRSPSDI